MPGLPLVPRRQPGRARVHRVRPGAAGEERVLPAVLGPAVRRPCLGRDRAPGGGRPGRGRREDRPSPAVLRPDGTAHGSRPRAAPRRPRRALPPQAAWVQPGLPSPHARPGRRPPASPSLAAAIRVADRLAEARGWSGEIRRRVRQGLAIALDGHQEGQGVAWSRALPALRARHLCAGHVAEVLRQAGLLDDDRRPAFDAWLDRKLDGVTAGIRRDAERWLRTLKDGGPRSRPRSIATVHSHLGKALPALLDWSARYHHLREVTRDDIQDHVRGLHGPQRHNALVALRSLFRFCLSAGVIFRNPARGIKVGRRPSATVLQPLGQEDIDDAVAAAATPAARLIVALAGVHAARSSAICALLLARRRPGQRPPAPGRPAPPPGRPHRPPAPHLARGPPRQMARNRQPAPAHQRPDRPGHRAGQQDLGQLRPARPRRDHRGAARRPPARGSPGHRRRPPAPGSHLRPGPRHRRPLRIQRPAAPPDRSRAAGPRPVPREPKARNRSRRLKTPQFPPAIPQSG